MATEGEEGPAEVAEGTTNCKSSSFEISCNDLVRGRVDCRVLRVRYSCMVGVSCQNKRQLRVPKAHKFSCFFFLFTSRDIFKGEGQKEGRRSLRLGGMGGGNSL